jgi:uncharacterized protein (DUF924 family)
MSLFSKALPSSKRVLLYWFDQIPCVLFRNMWYTKSDVVDTFIKQEFSSELQQLQISKPLTDNPYDILSNVIVYDQFPRNIFRNSPMSFSYESLALSNANRLLDNSKINLDATNNFSKYEWSFIYMPFMHSEKLQDQERSLEFFGKSHSFAKEHHDIIKRFNRFPHRNEILGRKSTDDEIEFLKDFTGF